LCGRDDWVRSAIMVKPSSLLNFHRALVHRKYRICFPQNAERGRAERPKRGSETLGSLHLRSQLCCICIIGPLRNTALAQVATVSNFYGLSVRSRRAHATRGATPLDSDDCFVLENADYYPSILGVSFRRLIVADLVTFSHCAWRKHSRERDMTLLNQDIGHTVGAVLTELLVEAHAPDGRGVAFHLDYGSPRPNAIAADCNTPR
jgi:hypothetical protein